MIHEFAVEPEVMATWSHFRVLWEDFGVSRGRLLVEFPKEWRKRVYALAPELSPPVRANALCSKLGDPAQRLHRTVGPGGRAFVYPADWLRSAVGNQSTSRPFHAIVARSSSSGRPDVLAADELERDTEPWRVSTQDLNCPRTAVEMAARAGTLLRCSEELILVDPYFDPSEPRFVWPFEAFVGVCPGWKRLELHRAKPEAFDRDVQEDKYRRNLVLAVPTGTTLEVFFWPGLPAGGGLHPRFVLTERGGIQFDHGLDEGQSTAQTTLVTLLEHEVFLQLRSDYRRGSVTFGTPDVLSIHGKG